MSPLADPPGRVGLAASQAGSAVVPARRRRWRPGRAGGLAAVGYAFVITMAGATLPTPLYPLYRQRFGFSELMITVIFATYAVGVMAALLLFGELSDRIGRRAVLVPGLALSAASTALFLTADGLPVLLVGRVLSGLSAGLFTGTATAAIVDLAAPGRAARAALLATAANIGGLGCGPLLAGAVARYADNPLRLTFVLDLVLLVPAVAGVLLMPETVRRAPGAPLLPGGWRPLLRRPRVPAKLRAMFATAVLAGFAGFAVLGQFTAVSPAFLARELGEPSPLVAGAVVFGVFQASAVGQALARRVPTALPAGCVGLIVGMALVAAALAARSLPLLVAGGLLAGAGQGLSFSAGLGALVAAASQDERAEVSSAFFVVAYIALSLPVVGIGVAAELASLRVGGLAFAAMVAVLAAAVLPLLRRVPAPPARR